MGGRKGQIAWNKGIKDLSITGDKHPNWNGGKHVDHQGYVRVKNYTSPNRDIRNYVHEHVLMVEDVLGKPLRKGALVHHVDEDKTHNENSNFVVCQDRAYHILLHQRMEALKACGNADWRKCSICKEYDAPQNLYIPKKGSSRHLVCCNEYRRINGMNTAVYRRNRKRRKRGVILNATT